MIKIAVCGVCGKMGTRIASNIYKQDGVELTGAIEHKNHACLGKDVGTIIGVGNINVPVSANLADALSVSDVVIDFSSVDATDEILEESVRHNKAVVIGTTGLTDIQREKVKKTASYIPCLFSPNMSIGINVVFNLLKNIAPIFEEAYDIEIIEAHHRFKRDAPSGTAVKMAEIIADSLNRDLKEVGCYKRHGDIGRRPDKEIGIQTIRAGDIVGEHTVMFGGIGERVEITHKAQSRDTFALGAVKAARWLYEKPKGLYDMQDVLGLNSVHP